MAAIAGVLNSTFSVAYYLRLILLIIRPQPAGTVVAAKEAPITMLIPMCVMSAFIVIFGVWPEPVLAFAERAAGCLIN